MNYTILAICFLIAAAAAYGASGYYKEGGERWLLCLTGIFGIAAMVTIIWSLK